MSLDRKMRMALYFLCAGDYYHSGLLGSGKDALLLKVTGETMIATTNKSDSGVSCYALWW
jgi:hypothetical protein